MPSFDSVVENGSTAEDTEKPQRKQRKRFALQNRDCDVEKSLRVLWVSSVTSMVKKINR
jgi:hypothetical protein